MAEPHTRVVLAEDDVLLRKGLASLLAGAGFEVVGRYGTPAELTAQVSELRPDPVIVDIRMPPTHTTEGLDAARRIRQELPETAILGCRRPSRSSRPPSCSAAEGARDTGRRAAPRRGRARGGSRPRSRGRAGTPAPPPAHRQDAADAEERAATLDFNGFAEAIRQVENFFFVSVVKLPRIT
jgi:CheY-like chemotaxis protein